MTTQCVTKLNACLFACLSRIADAHVRIPTDALITPTRQTSKRVVNVTSPQEEHTRLRYHHLLPQDQGLAKTHAVARCWCNGNGETPALIHAVGSGGREGGESEG
ncbi:hypothetical protein T484DRAFT_1970919 [Baffinella frigidus]|nr:hypothetical protein T484DRAFT_1970919 [Cryptophyta sp. CCMP2293]